MAQTSGPLTNFASAHTTISTLVDRQENHLALYRNTKTAELVIYKSTRTRNRHIAGAQAVFAQLREHQPQPQDETATNTIGRGRRTTHSAYQHSLAPHPHIQATLDCAFSPIDEVYTTITILTPYYAGGDLHQLHARYSAASRMIPESFILHVFGQIASALEFLHTGANQSLRCSSERRARMPWRTNRRAKIASNGTVPTLAPSTNVLARKWTPMLHCDVKPSNIALLPSNTNAYPTATLIDFDISLLSSSASTKSSAVNAIGATARYAAPEHPLASPASDIWSLGATVHFLCTGKTVRQPPSRVSSRGSKAGSFEGLLGGMESGSRSPKKEWEVEDYVIRRRRFADTRFVKCAAHLPAFWAERRAESAPQPEGANQRHSSRNETRIFDHREKGYTHALEKIVFACLELEPSKRCSALQLRGKIEKCGKGNRGAFGLFKREKEGMSKEDIELGLWGGCVTDSGEEEVMGEQEGERQEVDGLNPAHGERVPGLWKCYDATNLASSSAASSNSWDSSSRGSSNEFSSDTSHPAIAKGSLSLRDFV